MRLRWPYWALGCATLAIPAYFLVSPIRNSPPPAAPLLAPAGRSTLADMGAGSCSEIYQAICQKRGETRDPTGGVKPDVDGELQALRTYERIIREHPEWSSSQVDDELVATIYTPERRSRLRSAYSWVVRSIERFIREQPDDVFTAGEKRRLITRVRKTELQLPPPAAVYRDEPDLFTKNDVLYERMLDGRTRLRVGGAYLLSSKSWFNIIFTMAHELGHAIDPCELRAARLSIPAYDRLSACFMANGLIAARSTRQECGENDQLSETFADWMAVQVVSEALRNFSTEFHGRQLASAAMNSVRDLCEQDEEEGEPSNREFDLTFHPSPKIRIDRIFGRNPGIREVLGCEALPADDTTPEYCDFDFTAKPLVAPRKPATNKM